MKPSKSVRAYIIPKSELDRIHALSKVLVSDIGMKLIEERTPNGGDKISDNSEITPEGWKKSTAYKSCCDRLCDTIVLRSEGNNKATAKFGEAYESLEWFELGPDKVSFKQSIGREMIEFVDARVAELLDLLKKDIFIGVGDQTKSRPRTDEELKKLKTFKKYKIKNLSHQSLIAAKKMDKFVLEGKSKTNDDFVKMCETFLFTAKIKNVDSKKFAKSVWNDLFYAPDYSVDS